VTCGTINVMIVEELIDFLTTASEAKLIASEVPNNPWVTLYTVKLRNVITFSSLLASTMEYLEKDISRGSEYFEKFADLHHEVGYVDLTDLEYITASLVNKFRTIYRAYAPEIDNTHAREACSVVLRNLEHLEYCLCQCKSK
jgi:hypothetical protein